MKPGINNFRAEINSTDKEIIKLISRRLRLVEKIGKLKKKAGVKVLDKSREKELANLRQKSARKLGIEIKFINDVFSLVIKESKKRQK